MKKNRGMALMEIVIGASILSIAIIAINVTYKTYIDYALGNQKNAEAAFILQEGLEVMTFLRDQSWDDIENLATSTPHYLAFNGTNWATSTTPEYVDGTFLRSITVESVFRDVNDDITYLGGTDDPNTRKITATVSYWQGHATTTRSLSTYVANIRD